MDETLKQRGRTAVYDARRASNEERLRAAEDMRELGEELDGAAQVDVNAVADLLERVVDLIEERTDDPRDGDRLDRTLDELNLSLTGLEHHFA